MKHVAILGCGVVGSGVAEVLKSHREGIRRRCGEELSLRYILVRRRKDGSPWQEYFTEDFSVIENDPEVSLVAIIDADKEGFLRSERSMIQTIGRAARNAGGEVVMYADRMTGSMQRAIDETERRRELQMAYNRAHGIVPKTVRKDVRADIAVLKGAAEEAPQYLTREVPSDAKGRKQHLQLLEKAMKEAAKNLEFEIAAELRDEIRRIEAMD